MNFSVLVNTNDSFEDCWIPFFILFTKYWPDYSGKIYLNSEKKKFQFNGLNIECLQNSSNLNRKLTWSECLIYALNSINETIILYMQEDYFLTGMIKHNKIIELVNLMRSDNQIDCIHLTDQATPGPFLSSSYPEIKLIDQNAPCRLSTQAALWKKNILLKYVKKHESAWLFEDFGTKRAKYLKDRFYNIDTNKYGIGESYVIQYVYTGIIKGQWNKMVIELFKKNNININYSDRGFHNKELNIKPSWNIKMIIEYILSLLDLWILYIKMLFKITRWT